MDGSSDRRSKRLFSNAKIPESLRGVSRQFDGLIDKALESVPPGPNRTEALESLLDAKDYALRAFVDAPPGKRWDALACRWVEKPAKPGPAIMPHGNRA